MLLLVIGLVAVLAIGGLLVVRRRQGNPVGAPSTPVKASEVRAMSLGSAVRAVGQLSSQSAVECPGVGPVAWYEQRIVARWQTLRKQWDDNGKEAHTFRDHHQVLSERSEQCPSAAILDESSGVAFDPRAARWHGPLERSEEREPTLVEREQLRLGKDVEITIDVTTRWIPLGQQVIVAGQLGERERGGRFIAPPARGFITVTGV